MTRDRGGGGLDFADWYCGAYPTVCRALRLAAGDAGLGEEVAAEAFARALVDWRKVSRLASPAGWVYGVGLNELRHTRRRLVLEQRHLARQRAESTDPPSAPDDQLWRAVARLAPRARTAVALRYVADLPEAEIAEIMGVARGTVAATLSSARKQLALQLAPVPERTDR
ncbi:sigma-70 family RNA polymerase sigma factor [Oerskovia sp. KBS0722]|uniref:sigma-70 family RNA polymerase sigma factor n=1 Tax=Oerskovia sp. KBS0722 TaxID=1179673 RepID=UPI00143D5BBD|nr:sigma-70 family RNA polymerase sigma factor [Oerskovia sp. KBS0722]